MPGPQFKPRKTYPRYSRAAKKLLSGRRGQERALIQQISRLHSDRKRWHGSMEGRSANPYWLRMARFSVLIGWDQWVIGETYAVCAEAGVIRRLPGAKPVIRKGGAR